jgi:hypothetical protein
VLGWTGFHLNQMAYLTKIEDQVITSQEALAKNIDQVNDEMDRLKDVFAKRREEINDVYQKNVDSWKRLLEVGAVKESEYANNIDKLNLDKDSTLALLNVQEEQQTDILKGILDQLQKGINVSIPTFQVPAYAAGTGYVDKDQIAQLHKGEIVTSRPISDSLRSGELSLSKQKTGTTVVYNFNINANGSIVTEGELVTKLKKAIDTKESRGHIGAIA